MRWTDLQPAFHWRASQRHVLDIAARVTDECWHLCAPPGAGKTLLALELARRLGRPTLVLSPTVVVREQWCAATAMFGADPLTFTSTSVTSMAPLISLTYQMLSNPGVAAPDLQSLARELWLADLRGQVDDPEARLTELAQVNPAEARRQLSSRARRIRGFLSDPEAAPLPVEQLLGERCSSLFDAIAGLDIGCIVLDECHHLLDWWALVVGALVDRLHRIGPLAVIGVTATLPDSDSSIERANYRRLLGDVDIELQLPALVAEAALAPWRDGVYMATPTKAELQFLDTAQEHLRAELDDILSSDTALHWITAQIVAASDPNQLDLSVWNAFVDSDPLAATSALGWWMYRSMAVPAAAELPDARMSYDVTARLILLHALLNRAPVASTERDEIRRRLARHGLAAGIGGWEPRRSVVDIVAARSDAKWQGAAAVLSGELGSRGSEMAALVVVEYDQATSPPAAARELLDGDSGTTARVMAGLCSDPTVLAAGVMSVTGRGAWADALSSDAIVALANVAVGGGRVCRAEGSDVRSVVRLVGEGGAWGPSDWLAVAEAAFDHGVIQTLVATRALVNEGWDCPSLNVLVDLSEVSTASATTQLRGRVLRLDPQALDKVASIWDVVVVHPAARGEWRRLVRRHQRWWGLDPVGSLTTGIAKLDPYLGRHEPPESLMPGINRANLQRLADRATTRAAWGAVSPGGWATSELTVRSWRRRTVRIRQPIAFGVRRLLAGLGLAGLCIGGAGVVAGGLAATVGLAGGGCAAGVAVLGRVVLRARVGDEASLLFVLADGLRLALAELGVNGLAAASVEVDGNGDGQLCCRIDADDDASDLWAAALGEMLGPLGTPRWMLVIGDAQAWRVPRAFTTAAASDRLHRHVHSRLPDVVLLRAGTPEATSIQPALAAQRPDEVDLRHLWSPARTDPPRSMSSRG